MKQKRKHKKTNKNKIRREEVLPVLLAVLVLLAAICYAQLPQVWEQAAAQTLNMAPEARESIADLRDLVGPIVQVAMDINRFYQLSATEMMELLDMPLGAEELTFFFTGVNEFYAQAASEMAQLLDMSDYSEWPSRVAGISIEK